MSARNRPKSAQRPRLLALVLGALVAVLLPVVSVAGPAGAAKSTVDSTVATSIRFDSVTTPDSTISLPGTPGAQDLWYVVGGPVTTRDATGTPTAYGAGTPFDVDLTFLRQDSITGDWVPAPLSTFKTVTVTVKYGSTILGTKDVDPNLATAKLTGLRIDVPASNVTLTASADTKPKAVTGTSRAFDVLIESLDVTGSLTSTGGGASTGPCSPAYKTVCGDLIPPAGVTFADGGLLSRGLCVGTRCKDTYVQALVDFTPSVTNPATLLMKCDKDLCGVGSIKSKTLDVTLSPGSQVQGDPRAVTYAAPACLDKGTVPYDETAPISSSNLPFCVDYVQSTRDNAGDTILFLLFVEDAKVRFS